MLRRRRLARGAGVMVLAIALFAAGTAAAGVDLRRVILKPGQCVTVAKVRVCAAKARPPVTKTVTTSVTLPPSTVTLPPSTVTAPPATVTAPPVTVTVITTATPKVAFADGIYRVGIDIEAGTYRSTAVSDTCYWERLRGFGGTLEEIIANDIGISPTIVTIASTDAGFRSNRCGGWSKIG